MFRLFPVLIVLFAATAPAPAAEPGGEAALAPFAVQIDVRGGGGGSGVYLGDRRVLTCEHLFAGGEKRAVVSFPGGAASAADLVSVDPTWDLALLALAAAPPGAHAARWASDLPRVGDAVLCGGYGQRGTLRVSPGVVRSYGYAKGVAGGPKDTLILSGAARPGDSGGPIVTTAGDLLGILWGTSGQEVVGTQVGRCQRFLKSCDASRAEAGLVRRPCVPNHPVTRGGCGPFGCPIGGFGRPGGDASPGVPPLVPAPPVPTPASATDMSERIARQEAKVETLLARLERIEVQTHKPRPAELSPEQMQRIVARLRAELRGALRVKVEPVR